MKLLNHYATLGVHKASTDAEVKAAHGLLAKAHHPDLHKNNPAKAAKMADINVAYNVLKNPKTRKEYDKQLALFGSKCPACEGKAVTMKQKGFSKKIASPCTTCAGTGVL
jgi:DnaJ-class molecular chaperone